MQLIQSNYVEISCSKAMTSNADTRKNFIRRKTLEGFRLARLVTWRNFSSSEEETKVKNPPKQTTTGRSCGTRLEKKKLIKEECTSLVMSVGHHLDGAGYKVGGYTCTTHAHLLCEYQDKLKLQFWSLISYSWLDLQPKCIYTINFCCCNTFKGDNGLWSIWNSTSHTTVGPECGSADHICIIWLYFSQTLHKDTGNDFPP